MFAQISNTAFLILFAAMILLNWRTILAAIGSGALIAALIFIAAAFAIGYFLAGWTSGSPRSVMGLGTAQRNVSAALVVAGQNFTDPDVLVMVLTGAILMLVILMPLAGELGRRAKAGPTAAMKAQ
jgi:BASS family bile acid:Na+ symporter